MVNNPGDIILDVAFFIIAIIGIIGNILVCLVVLLNKPMRTPMNYLLVNLAISDMTLLVFLTVDFVFHETLDDISCKFVTVLAWTGGYTSSLFLVAIAVERYFAVVRPHELHRRITVRKVISIVVLCWIIGLAWNSVGFSVKGFDDERKLCAGEWRYSDARKAYKILSFFAVGVVPVTIMSVLYSKVVFSLWFKANSSLSCIQNVAARSRKKVTKIVLSVSALYALCWLPELFLYVLKAYQPDLLEGTKLFPVTVALLCINSAANPMIYCFHSHRFRSHLYKLMKCRTVELLRNNKNNQAITSVNSPTTFPEELAINTY